MSNTIQANYRGRGPGRLTGINVRVKLTARQLGWLPRATLLLLFSRLSPATRAYFDPRDANASLLFQSLSVTARPPTAVKATFRFV